MKKESWMPNICHNYHIYIYNWYIYLQIWNKTFKEGIELINFTGGDLNNFPFCFLFFLGYFFCNRWFSWGIVTPPPTKRFSSTPCYLSSMWKLWFDSSQDLWLNPQIGYKMLHCICFHLCSPGTGFLKGLHIIKKPRTFTHSKSSSSSGPGFSLRWKGPGPPL